VINVEYVIHTEHLTKDFGTFCLSDINLELPGGAILGLIGENGAGKSTLIKCLLGALRPTSGTVELFGGTVAEPLEGVGYVPDECPFSSVLKVGQLAVMLSGMFPTWDTALFEQYLSRFQLPRERAVKELSRGMGMKLTIAAALAHRPRLLILDEATAGLDPVVRDEILDEFLNFISDEAHAILISSHITSDLEKVCDYVTYLHKGMVTISGVKDELLHQFARLSCTRAELGQVDPGLLVGARVGEYGVQALVNDRAAFHAAYPALALDPATLEDIMIFTTKGECT